MSIEIERLSEADFENQEWILESLEEIKELCPAIDSVEKLKAVFDVLNDNKPKLDDFLDPDKYTDNIDDYTEDAQSGLLFLKP